MGGFAIPIHKGIWGNHSKTKR